ncbi:EthD family reductase [Marinobacter sp. NFXS9]|uniref:EthD family reductase n=1 Tax=Marinobacter sp. NFXS9 TaxID=2818433 RepID=UPI0032DFC966
MNIKVSLLYASSCDWFGITYFRETHLPLMATSLGDVCRRVMVEEGIRGVGAGTPPAFSAVAHLYFDTLEDDQRTFDLQSEIILSDIGNFTDTLPVIQVGRVLA